MSQKIFYESTHLAGARMQEAVLCIFERPCIRLRTLALLCAMSKSSLHRRISQLDYVHTHPGGGVYISGAHERYLTMFSHFENDKIYKILYLCRTKPTLDEIAFYTGREKHGLRNTMQLLVRDGCVEKDVRYQISKGMREVYDELLRNISAYIEELDKILTQENLWHAISYEQNKIEVEIMGRKKTVLPYRRLYELIS
jgi:hypothetical protein